MNIPDALQAISLLVVAITLGLSAWQNRHAARQTQEAIRQSGLAHESLKQSAQHGLVNQGTASLMALLTGEPELLAWFLETRGIEPATPEVNKRYLLLFLRLEAHELNHVAYLGGSLPEDVWQGWRVVIATDAATPEFPALWRVVGRMYSAAFARLVDSILAEVPRGELVEAARLSINVDE